MPASQLELLMSKQTWSNSGKSSFLAQLSLASPRFRRNGHAVLAKRICTSRGTVSGMLNARSRVWIPYPSHTSTQNNTLQPGHITMQTYTQGTSLAVRALPTPLGGQRGHRVCSIVGKARSVKCTSVVLVVEARSEGAWNEALGDVSSPIFNITS